MGTNINVYSKLSVLALIVVVFLSVILFENKYSDKFYPGVYVDGKYVGGKTYAEVFGEYKKGADLLYEQGITLIFNGEKGKTEVNIPALASGLSSDGVVEYFSLGDWESSIKDAYSYGRSGTLLNKIKERSLGLIKTKIFNFPSVFQNEAIRSFYERELSGHFKEVVPAEFVYSGNKIIISAESNGEGVSFEDVSEEITQKLSAFDPTPILLNTKTITPPFTKEMLEPFLPVASEISKGINIYFKYKRYGWRVSGRRLVTWLQLDERGRLALNHSKVEAFLTKNITPVLDNRAMSSRFEMVNGELVEIEKGKSGNMVDVSGTVAKVEEVIFGKKRSLGLGDSLIASLSSIVLENSDVVIEDGYVIVPIDLKIESPRVTKETLQEYYIKELVGTATTNFTGSSEDRIHNIKVGVEKLTGLLIAPGEEFSTVFSLGTTTEEEGFVKEFVIKENKSVKELGGGLCQVATTMFRLALDAGLPITERYNHRYVVGYYGAGLDATIYDPHPDLRFINDTGKYLLLQGTVKDNTLTFEFFGQKDGRQVSISEPVLSDEKPAPPTKYLMSEEVPYATMQCSETPRKGVTAEVDYVVDYKGGGRNTQKFKSIYQPWGKICIIGTGK